MHLSQLFALDGRCALVTGGGRGIGRHIVLGLAEAGADVFLASRKLANCQEVAESIERMGRRAWAFEADLTRPEDCTRLVERVLAETDRLPILVNNSALAWGAPTLEYPLEAWDRVFALNVRGLWLVSQQVARHMREIGGGAILHISSISGFRGDSEEDQPTIAYNASKGAVITLTKDMAIKLAPYGIRVNSIAPGAFMTDMMNHIRADDETLRVFHARIPLQRSGGEDDIKGAAVFLVSDAAAYITGETLVVDGGVKAGGFGWTRQSRP